MKYVLCCVSDRTISSAFLKEFTEYLSHSGIELTETKHLSEGALVAVDLHLTIAGPLEEIKQKIMSFSQTHSVDMALIPLDHRGKGKLIVFDMDSTLIQHEVIDEMAMVMGIGDKVKIITERAMNGELNFDEALKERVSLLKGMKREKMSEIMSRLKLSPGVPELIRFLKNKGYKTGIISGGFKFFAEIFKTQLGLDYAFANDLEWDGDELSGKVKGGIINAAEKARIVEELARKENIDLSDVIAVGDGANDLLMLAKAGFGIAYHAKEKVRKEARYELSHGPMTTILYFLGHNGNHFI